MYPRSIRIGGSAAGSWDRALLWRSWEPFDGRRDGQWVSRRASSLALAGSVVRAAGRRSAGGGRFGISPTLRAATDVPRCRDGEPRGRKTCESELNGNLDGQPPGGFDVFALGMRHWALSNPHSVQTGTLCPRRILQALPGVLCNLGEAAWE